ncbi:MAG: S41 family peptidase [Bacteroidales bacterium]|nr:S41 family peptidase [Bacteroidales bacterium]
MKKEPIIIAILGIIIGACSVLTCQKITERTKNLKAEYEDWGKLNVILRHIEENYVDSIDFNKVTDAAAAAALATLDPHSIYMPPADLEETETELAGQFEGIGIQFNVPNDTATVIEVIPGGPSEKIGLQPGDRILKVDSTVIAGVKFPQDSMVRRMKGPAGTKVLITIKRDGEDIPFEITRGKIATHSVDAAFMVNDTTGYLRLSKFSRTTAQDFILASADLLSKGMNYMILDLRDNTGGFFDQALNLANLFLPKDAPIVYIEGRKRKREDYNANGKGILKDVKLSVLINDGSASSSEILAGAIQDNGRGCIIGRRSFGKGLVQEPLNFTDGSGIRLTVARFYTPSGRCIQKPYSEDYKYETLLRYNTSELVEADSMKVESGGIIPDVFIPIDTTKVGQFYINCNKKATTMRFASAYFDKHKQELSGIEDYDKLLKYLDSAGLEQKFLSFAETKDKLVPTAIEWKTEKQYMMTQVRALVGRYSKLGDKAFYHLYLEIDDAVAVALEH